MNEVGEKERNLYEVSFLLAPQVAEEQIPTETQQIKDVIEKHGGSITLTENPKIRGLAYTIVKSAGGKRQKFSQAYFGWVKFVSESGNIENIENDLTLDPNIIRKLVIHTVKATPPSTRRAPRPPALLQERVTEAEIDKEVEKLIESATPAK